MRAGSGVRVGGVALALAVVFAAAPSAGAGAADGPVLGAVYGTKGDEQGAIENLYLVQAATADRSGWVRFETEGKCGFAEVQAEMPVPDELRDRFQVYGYTGDGEQVLLELDVRGELGPDGGGGTLTTKTVDGPKCRDEQDWEIGKRRTVRGLRRFEAWVPGFAGEVEPLLAATADAVFLVEPDRANERSDVARIDPASNEPSTTHVDTVADDAVATADSVWLLDGTSGVLTRLDAATQRATARLELGAPTPDPHPDVPPAMLAVQGSTIWATVGDTRRLAKIDAVSGAVVATFALGGPPANLAAGPEGVYVELILSPRAAVDPETADLPRAERRTDETQYRAAERSQLQLLDAASGAVRTETETYALRAFAVGPGGLYSGEAYTELVLRDPVTLVEGISGDHLTWGFAFAAPGVWLTGADGLVAVDASSLAKRARVPYVYPAYAHGVVAAFDSIWVVEWGGATRIRGGADG